MVTNRRLPAILAVVLIAACLGAACGGNPTEPTAVPLDQPFDLRAGQSAVVPGGLKVTFDRVVSDSRCPIDAICVWAGEAVIALKLSRGFAAPVEREVRADSASPEISHLAVHDQSGRALAVSTIESEDPIGGIPGDLHGQAVRFSCALGARLTLTSGRTRRDSGRTWVSLRLNRRTMKHLLGTVLISASVAGAAACASAEERATFPVPGSSTTVTVVRMPTHAFRAEYHRNLLVEVQGGPASWLGLSADTGGYSRSNLYRIDDQRVLLRDAHASYGIALATGTISKDEKRRAAGVYLGSFDADGAGVWRFIPGTRTS